MAAGAKVVEGLSRVEEAGEDGGTRGDVVDVGSGGVAAVEEAEKVFAFGALRVDPGTAAEVAREVVEPLEEEVLLLPMVALVELALVEWTSQLVTVFELIARVPDARSFKAAAEGGNIVVAATCIVSGI